MNRIGVVFAAYVLFLLIGMGASVAFPSGKVISYWDFDGDLTDAGYAGKTVQNNSLNFTTGWQGMAIETGPGAYGYISAANAAAYDEGEDLSICLAYKRYTNTLGRILSRSGGTNDEQFQISNFRNGAANDFTGSAMQGWNNAGAGQIAYGGVNTASTAHFSHYCYVFDTQGDDFVMYVNGTLDTNSTGIATIKKGITEPIAFGAQSQDGTYTTPFYGAIDSVMIYNGTLNASQVSELYGLNGDPFAGGGGGSNVTFTPSSDQIIGSVTYNVSFTNSTDTLNYYDRTGALTTDILTTSTELWNYTVNASNHYTYNNNSVNVSGGSLAPTLTTTDKTVSARYRENTQAASIGNAWATIDSYTYEPLANTTAFALAVLETNASGGSSTSSCRILIDGSDYDSTATRSLSAGTLGNLYLTTNDFNVSPSSNVTVATQCRKTGGANYNVDYVVTSIQSLYSTNDATNITNVHANGTGISVNTTWQPVFNWTYTTDSINISNRQNLLWVFNYRGSNVYGSTGNLTTQLYLDGDSSICQNVTRYGTAGSTGSWGNSCLASGLKPGTTYNVSVYARTTSGTSTINDGSAHTFQAELPVGSYNSTIVNGTTFNATTSTIANITMYNPIGGGYAVMLIASVNVRASSGTPTGQFYLTDGSTSLISHQRTLSSAGNGNIAVIGLFNESGTGSKTYSLNATCATGTCELASVQLIGYVVNQQNVSTNNFTVYAWDNYAGASINTFNVTVLNTTFSTTTGSVQIPISGATADVRVRSETYFSNLTLAHDTTTSLNATLQRWTGIYGYSYSGGAYLENYTVNYNGTDYTAVGKPGYIPLYNTTGNVTINASGYSLRSANITATGYLINYTFYLYDTNTFDITFYNETTNDLVNATVYWEIIGSAETRNGSTQNASINESLLTPDDYEIRYWVTSDVPRSYYVTLTNQSFKQISLYVVDKDISSWYVAIVEDPTTTKCENMTVSMLRYYVDLNAYVTVEMARTDSNGQAVLRVVPNYVPYKFIFTGSCGTFTSSPSQLIDTSNTYTVTDAQSVLTSTYLDVSSSLTYNNVTSTFVYTWSDPTNIVRFGCLDVTVSSRGITRIENSTCQNGATGSLIYTVNQTANATYIAQGSVKTNTEFSQITTNTLSINLYDNTTLRNMIPIAAVLILVTLILFGNWSAATTLVAAIAGIILIAWSGLAPLSWTTVTSWIIVLGISLYKLRR